MTHPDIDYIAKQSSLDGWIVYRVRLNGWHDRVIGDLSESEAVEIVRILREARGRRARRAGRQPERPPPTDAELGLSRGWESEIAAAASAALGPPHPELRGAGVLRGEGHWNR